MVARRESLRGDGEGQEGRMEKGRKGNERVKDSGAPGREWGAGKKEGEKMMVARSLRGRERQEGRMEKGNERVTVE